MATVDLSTDLITVVFISSHESDITG